MLLKIVVPRVLRTVNEELKNVDRQPQTVYIREQLSSLGGETEVGKLAAGDWALTTDDSYL